jgi:hypothetical protein
MTNVSNALVPFDAFEATADLFKGFSERKEISSLSDTLTIDPITEVDLSRKGLEQFWQYQILGLRKDILELSMHLPDSCVHADLNQPQKAKCRVKFHPYC